MVAPALYRKFRNQAEAYLLKVGFQEGTVSHHKKNWAVVYNFHGLGGHRAVLLDAGRCALSRKACRGDKDRLALMRYDAGEE